MDGFVSLEVQKITFLIFKSLTLRQITALYRKIKCGFCCFLTENTNIFRGMKILSVILSASGLFCFWQGSNQRIHPCRAVPLHLVTYMGIGLQCERGGVMPQIRLHCLDVVAVFQRDRRK